MGSCALIPAFLIALLDPKSEPARVGALAHATAALIAAVPPAVTSPAGSQEPAGPEASGPGIAEPIDKQLTFAYLHVPRGVGTSAGVCDLLIHFHGAPETTIPAFDSAGVRATLLLVNLGMTGEPYVESYSQQQAFAKLLEATQKSLGNAMPEAERCTIGRVALSAFSAGYAAVARILNVPENVARVDTVLLADAMHAPYADKLTRQVDRRGMTGIVGFARLAAEGDRMLSITHSSIDTEDYASTSRTALELIGMLGVEPVPRVSPGPRLMTMKYRADKRGLHVRGYAGSDGAAHSDHLRAIGQTLFPELRDRWTSLSAR